MIGSVLNHIDYNCVARENFKICSYDEPNKYHILKNGNAIYAVYYL